MIKIMKYDFIIIGSGIIGLTLAYKLKKTKSNAKSLFWKKSTILFNMDQGEIVVLYIVEFITTLVH